MGSIFVLSCLCVFSTVFAIEKESEYTYTDNSLLLNYKSLNIYEVSEISNVCYDGSNLLLFSLPSSQEKGVEKSIQNTGLTWKHERDSGFSSKTRSLAIQPIAVGALLTTSSSEDFQAYRLLNSLLYLSRNGVSASVFSAVYLHTGRAATSYSNAVLERYFEILASHLDVSLQLDDLKPFCVQQLILIATQPSVKDVIYQLDDIFIRKLIYKGKPQYPIPRRKFSVLINTRPEVPMWKSLLPVHNYFDKIAKNCAPRYETLGQLSSSAVINLLKNTDIFVTTYGDDSVFLLFLVPYSVFIEVQPDYFHDSTTSIMAYAADVYPIVVRDVYSDIPSSCQMDDGLILSELEPCRTTLREREIDFDIKSMTQAMAQAQYYLWNYKMKEIPYCFVRSKEYGNKQSMNET